MPWSKSTQVPPERARRLRKRTVEKVIRECFWEGFQEGLGNGLRGALEYASTSGLYDYNGVRQIAQEGGYDLAQELLAAHVEHINGRGPRIPMGFEYKIPAEVVAKCYAEARIG